MSYLNCGDEVVQADPSFMGIRRRPRLWTARAMVPLMDEIWMRACGGERGTKIFVITNHNPTGPLFRLIGARAG